MDSMQPKAPESVGEMRERIYGHSMRSQFVRALDMTMPSNAHVRDMTDLERAFLEGYWLAEQRSVLTIKR